MVRSESNPANKNTVKAAFTYNFIKYITWPNENDISELSIGFYGSDNNYYRALRKMNKKKVRNFSLTTSRITDLKKLDEYHVVILDEERSKELSFLAQKLVESSTLIISELSLDKKHLMLNFVYGENDTLTFELNRYKMLTAKLSIDSDIVVLGGNEVDIATVLKELNGNLLKRLNELKLQKGKQVLIEQKLTDGQMKMKLQEDKLSKQTEKLIRQNILLQKNNDKFTTLEQNNKRLNNERVIILEKLNKSQNRLSELQTRITMKEDSVTQLANKIDERQQVLDTLYERQAAQELSLANKEAEIVKNRANISEQLSVISTQYSYIIYAAIGIACVLIIIIFVYRSNLVKQKMNRELSHSIDDLNTTNQYLKDVQAKLVESEKMAALGGLVAGVAHEINTPLGVSVTAASHLSDYINNFQEEYTTGALKRSSLNALLSNCNESSSMLMRNLTRASDLIRHFKQIAVDQTSEHKRIFELKSYLEQLIDSLTPQLKVNKHKVVVHSEGEIKLNSFPGAIAQIFSNLIMNSVLHGFKHTKNGLITISLEVKSQAEQEFVHIDYLDNGSGITSSAQKKVFDPFYTTARGSGGSGLGMSISYNLVVNNLNGEIHCIDSYEGANGAHFQIQLPLHTNGS